MKIEIKINIYYIKLINNLTYILWQDALLLSYALRPPLIIIFDS